MINSELIKGFIQSDIIKVHRGDVLNPSDNLIESGIIDSIGIQLLIAFLERTFSIVIADYEVVPDNFETVEAIAMFVQSKKHDLPPVNNNLLDIMTIQPVIKAD